MGEHYTQGRQGQGARRRRYHQSYNHRHRMPRPEDAPVKKKSFLQKLLGFLGFGKKKETGKDNPASRSKDKNARSNVRVARGRGQASVAPRRGRRAASVVPTENSRLYVGNLAYEATESEIEELFKGFGNVRSVEVIYNPRTYKSKGYAFVEMARLADAQKATEVLHGQPFMGRELMVSAASDRMEHADSSKDGKEGALADGEREPSAVDSSPAPGEPTEGSGEASKS